MLPDDQPTIPTAPPNGSRPAPIGWQAPSVEEMQAMLPQYEIMEILGRGGMGAVYKGRQKSLKRLVAIKILPLGMADDEMKFAERFQNEAQTMAAMNHPAIVSVYDFGETPDGLLYFIMEFVDGTDVQKMIQASGRLSGEYALAITAHVCDALSYAHKRGVIHRDIKPANILIDQEGHIKVADFGLAKMNDPAQTSGLTKTNMAMGTPDYVAPEVLVTGMVADHRADIYAVGVMLYQMLTGEVPRGMFKLPSQKGLGTDMRFDQIICKAMEQDRDERYQSAMDVRRDLDVILTTPQPKDDGKGVVSASQIPQKPVAKQPRPPGERSQPPAQKPAPQQAPAQKAAAAPKAIAPPKKQSPAAMWLSIGGIVAVLGVAGFLIFGGKPKPQASAPTDTVSANPPSAKPQSLIKVRENPKPTAPASSASAKGKEIDLLALVDVKRDAMAGEWERTADGLVKKGGNTTNQGAPRLQLPYQPPEEYDYEIEFTPTAGTQAVGQIIAAQSRMFSWIVNGGRAGDPMIGFEMFDSKATSTPSEVSKRMDGELVNGRRYRSRVEVRSGSLRGFLDDKEIVNWNGKLQRLALDAPTRLRDDGHLGIRAVRQTTFHKITVREITGTGKMDAGAETTSSSATAKTIDLLPLVDVKRDMIAGEWSRAGGDLLVKAAKPDAKGNPRLQLPYQPPEEYDFEIEFTPESGTNMVGQVLSGYQHSFAWFLDAQLTAGNKAGFNEIDGVSVASRTDGTTMRAKFLTNGQRHRSTVEVRRTGVRALLDGETLVKWGASPKSYERLDIWKNEKLRDALHLGLVAYDRAVRFHKVTVREITGAGKVDADSGWSDWLGPILASGKPPVGSWRIVEDGVTTDQPISGTNVIDRNVRDAAVRISYDLRDGSGIQIAMRERRPGADRETYFVDDTGSGLYIARMAPGGAITKIEPPTKYPAGTPRTGPRTLEFRCVGNRLEATMTGATTAPVTVAVTDATLTAGPCAVVLKKGALLKKVEVLELDRVDPTGIAGANESPASPLPQKQIIGNGKMDAPQAAASPISGNPEAGVIDWLKTVPWPAPWALEGGQLKSSVKGVTRYLGTGRDASVRLRFLDEPAAAISKTSPPLQVTFYADAIGSNPQATYQLQIFPAGPHLHLLRLNKDAQTQAEVPTFVWKDVALPSASQKGEFELELRALAGELSVWSGTERLASTRDDRGKAGGWVFIGSPGVAISGFETSGITRGSDSTSILKSTSDMPAGATWKDVTTILRENVAKKSGYTVDAKGVSRSIGAPIGDTMVMGPSEKDRAVRVNYIGQAQVSLWLKGGVGSAYVLAAKDRVMIKRQTQKVGEADSMMPSVVHPAGFDLAQPHELIVAVRGCVVRAWLDGRYIGEVEDAALRECSIAIVPMSSSTVQKVEAAELPAVSPAADGADVQWQPIFNQPADFGGDLRDDVEFRDGATFIKARTFLAPPNSAIVGIRSTMRYLDGDRTGSLTLRSTEGAKYGEEDFALTAYIAPKGTSLVVKMRDRPAGIDQLGRHDYPLSPALKEGDPFTFELRAEDRKLIASINSREVGYVDDKWTGATRRFGITPSVTEMTEFRDVAVQLKATDVWTDWLGPKLAAGDFAANGWSRSTNGVTTEREISGLRLLPPGTKNAAVRVTYVLQDSQGLMLNARERMDGKVRLGYCAIDKVTQLHLNRLKPDGRSAALQHVILPVEADRMAERTLELRMIGNQITATLNGTFAGTATDDNLSEGEWTIVFLKGVLVKKVEVQPLDAAP